ncbi:hypothetical protein AW939_10975 [Pseudomonas aeruginosa]|nr:hypothetical protein AW939_10975 [Pseudomonas aeruginosa]
MVTAVGLTCACAEYFCQRLPLSYRSLSFEEYQAKRQAILEEKPQTAVSQSNAALRSTAI